MQNADGGAAEGFLHLDEVPGSGIFSKVDMAGGILTFTSGSSANKVFLRSFLEENGLSFPEGSGHSGGIYLTCMALALADRVAVCGEPLLVLSGSEGGDVRVNGCPCADSADPAAIYNALLHLRAGLEQAGIYDQVEKGYRVRALCEAIAGLEGAGTPEGYLELYRTLLDGGFGELGLLELDPDALAQGCACDACAKMRSIVSNHLQIKLYGNGRAFEDGIKELNGGLLLDEREVGGKAGRFTKRAVGRV